MNWIQWMFGPAISRMVMSSQRIKKDLFQEIRAIQSKGGIKVEHHPVCVSKKSHVALDMVLLQPEILSQPEIIVGKKKLILFVLGKDDCYEKRFNELLSFAKDHPEHTIAAFNFRGVQASTGTAYTPEDWVDDFEYAIQYLNGLGYKNKNIIVYGHSLGAAISTLGAAQVYKKSKEKESLCLINDRTFSNLPEIIMRSYTLLGLEKSTLINGLVYGVLGGLFAYTLPLLVPAASITIGLATLAGACLGGYTAALGLLHPEICYALLRPWVNATLYLTFGRIDVEKALRTLPEAKVKITASKRDHLMNGLGSLYHTTKDMRDRQRRILNKEIREIYKELNNPEIDTQQRDRLLSTMEKLEKRLELENAGYWEHRYNRFDGNLSHNDPAFFLRPVTPTQFKTGKEVFEGQVEDFENSTRMLKV